jgi:hypothetical protein
MDVEIKSSLGQFITIQEQTSNVINNVHRDTLEHRNFQWQTDSIVASYNDAREDFKSLMNKQKVNISLKEIEYDFSDDRDKILGILRMVLMQSSKAVNALEQLVSPLSIEQLAQLKPLKEELKKLSLGLDNINYEKNLNEAIEKFERGNFLASALISSKVILYSLEQIRGGDVNKIIDFLIEKKILKEKGTETKEFILKANKKARNYFTHDINVFPNPSDVLSLLGDCMKILEILIKLKET